MKGTLELCYIFSTCEMGSCVVLYISACKMRSGIVELCFYFLHVEHAAVLCYTFLRVELPLVLLNCMSYFSACGMCSGTVEFRVIYFCGCNVLWNCVIYFCVWNVRWYCRITFYTFLCDKRALVLWYFVLYFSIY